MPHKLYKGVYEKKGKEKWYAQCSHGGENAYIGTYNTELEAALAYDKRGRELKRPEEKLNFPKFLTEHNPPAATEPALPLTNALSSSVQVNVPSGSSSSNVGRGEKRKQITISKEEYDAYLPYHEARKIEFAQRGRNVSVSGVAIRSQSANISSAIMELIGNPGEFKDVPDEELLSDAEKEFVESLLNQGTSSDDGKLS